jgi:hypothetical protein
VIFVGVPPVAVTEKLNGTPTDAEANGELVDQMEHVVQVETYENWATVEMAALACRCTGVPPLPYCHPMWDLEPLMGSTSMLRPFEAPLLESSCRKLRMPGW